MLITVGGENYASHNYDLNVGSNYPVQAIFPPGVTSPFGTPSPTARFYENRGVAPRWVSIDGMSNTVAAAETIRSNQNSRRDPSRPAWCPGNRRRTRRLGRR